MDIGSVEKNNNEGDIHLHDMDDINKMKQEGNEMFKKKEFDKALDTFTSCLVDLHGLQAANVSSISSTVSAKQPGARSSFAASLGMETDDTVESENSNTSKQHSNDSEAMDIENGKRIRRSAIDVSDASTNPLSIEDKEISEDMLILKVALLNNRSLALHSLGRYIAALEDAEQACALDPYNAKSYHRKASALIGMQLFDSARDAFKIGLKKMNELQSLTTTAANEEGSEENSKALSPAIKRHAYDAKIEAFMKDQLNQLESKIDNRPALAKIESYVKTYGTILGCPTKLSASLFDMVDLVGEGNYSTVFKAKFIQTGEMFAIKVIDKVKAERMSRRHTNINNELKMERRVLYKLNHPNIVKLFHTFQDAKNLYFVSEYSIGGELWRRLLWWKGKGKRLTQPSRNSSSSTTIKYSQMQLHPPQNAKTRTVALRPTEAKFYLAQLVLALEYLARQGVVHRDFKPENVMILPGDKNGNFEYKYHSDEDTKVYLPHIERLKLIDFGTARDLVSDELNAQNFVGTPEYMSPETIRSNPAENPADLWALGCTIYQMHTGRLPFKAASPYLTFLKIEQGEFDTPPYVEKETDDVIRALLKKNPKERLGANDYLESLKKHSYFHDVDFDALLKFPIKPVPKLSELCVEAAAKIALHAPIDLQDFGNKSDLLWKNRDGSISFLSGAMSIENLTNDITKENDEYFEKMMFARYSVMGYLEQRGLLNSPRVMELFFQTSAEARFARASRRGYIGHSMQEEGEFKEGFIAIHANISNYKNEASNLIENEDGIKKAFGVVNNIYPQPRLLILTGILSKGDEANGFSVQNERNRFNARRSILSVLDNHIPSINAPSFEDLRAFSDESQHENPNQLRASWIKNYQKYCSDDYFSFFLGGVFIIVLNSSLMQYACMENDSSIDSELKSIADEHLIWFERQLFIGKLSARHAIVCSNHLWFDCSGKSTDEVLKQCEGSTNTGLISNELRRKYLRKMQSHGVAYIFSNFALTQKQVSISSSSDMEPKLVQVGHHDHEFIRLVRVRDHEVVSDIIAPETIPFEVPLDGKLVPIPASLSSSSAVTKVRESLARRKLDDDDDGDEEEVNQEAVNDMEDGNAEEINIESLNVEEIQKNMMKEMEIEQTSSKAKKNKKKRHVDSNAVGQGPRNELLDGISISSSSSEDD